MSLIPANRILVDARNWDTLREFILDQVRTCSLIGIDIETHDDDRHDGLNRMMKVDDEGFKAGNTRLVFDTNRTTITGFSLYPHPDYAYYFNLAQADVENRLPVSVAFEIAAAQNETAYWCAHNAPYELTQFRKSIGLDLGPRVICTMQMAVSAFNSDTYNVDDFLAAGLGEITRLMPQICVHFSNFDPKNMTKEQEELIGKVCAKESTAAHSYNGLIDSIAFTYGLKKLALRFLGYEQTTFEQVLNGKPHMGHLTGEEVALYGADDAWVCVKLFYKLQEYMMNTNPQVISTFFSQENPMIHVFSQVWGHGVKINLDAVKKHQHIERATVCETLKTMKAAVKALLPFPQDVHDKLLKYDVKGYGKPGTAERYRQQITSWANMPDCIDPFDQVYQVRGAVSKQWAGELGKKESSGLNLTYYQVVRAILYDLCRCSFQLSHGKIQSDADARDTMLERLEKKEESIDPERFEHIKTILKCYKALANSDTTMKLFINLYLNLTDPDTGKIYPLLNSLLDSRRMALSLPNLSQLPKFGGSAYVRSFFEPDEEDYVIMSMDWSGIELVLIGEESGDPAFLEAYGQLPHGDLHSISAAGCMDLSVPDFKALPNNKELRRDVGKGANFGYWYSGALSGVGQELGWSSDEMWEKTEKYRNTYPVAEQWRVDTIQFARENGYVTLRDGHQRIRFESTYVWAEYMRAKFAQYGEEMARFGEQCIRRIQTRSGNQAVNSKIQGGCATLAKRAILRVIKRIKDEGIRARFMFPVHDELVFSVHRDDVWRFKQVLWECMCDHPDLIKLVKLDASAAIGLNYQAWDEKENPVGQVELNELSKLPIFSKERWGQVATEEECQAIINYLFEVRNAKNT